MTVEVGREVTHADIGSVPPGTEVSDHYSRTGIVLDNGYVATSDGASFPLYSLCGWRYTRIGVEPDLDLNVDTFRQRAYTVCTGSARQHGVSLDPVFRALERIGASDARPPLGVGMHVHFNDNPLRERIDRKRGVILGHGNPNHWKGYGEWDSRFSNRSLGGVHRSARSLTMQVLAMDDPETEVYLRPATDEDRAEIARLRGVMWEIGVRAKRANSWCAAYETSVALLGVGPSSVTQITAQQDELAAFEREAALHPRDNVRLIRDWTEVDAFPAGAVFEYCGGSPSSDDGARSPLYTETQWNWMRRIDGWRYSTRNFIGPNGGHHGGLARVLWDGSSPMNIPIYRDLMPHLPVGTVLGHGVSRYTKEDTSDRPWANGTARAGDVDFFGGASTTTTWTITALPDRWEYGARCSNAEGTPTRRDDLF